MAKKKVANVLPKLTEIEQDLLSQIQDGYQLEPSSVKVKKCVLYLPIATLSKHWNSTDSSPRQRSGPAHDRVAS
jgi:hypothetical protein